MTDTDTTTGTTTADADAADLATMQALFAAFGAGDVPNTMGGWHESARWHPVTPGPWTESQRRDDYFGKVLATWMAERPDYRILDVQLASLGGLVIAGLTSDVGRGVLVYRLVDGKVSECWVINADGSDSTDGF